jgi:hypothetical protein
MRGMSEFDCDLMEFYGSLSPLEIVPALDELRAKMNAPARPWFKRAVDFGRVLPKVIPSFFTMDPATIIGSILTDYAGQFFYRTLRRRGEGRGPEEKRAVPAAP